METFFLLSSVKSLKCIVEAVENHWCFLNRSLTYLDLALREEKLETRKLARRFFNSQGIHNGSGNGKSERDSHVQLIGSVTNYIWRYRERETQEMVPSLRAFEREKRGEW